MRILGIETSCDETATAVVEDGRKILSNVIATSAEMHAKTGGIIPEQAARQQIRSIVPVIQKAISDAAQISNFQARSAKLRSFPISNEFPNERIQKWIKENIDAIAVTVGPGLIGSLLVGVETAKTLSYLWKKPIIPVNHLVAHIYANWLLPEKYPKTNNLQPITYNRLPEFPALALVVSGGHTDIVLMSNHGQLKWIGGTRDDAAGEAFDKCARLLGLPYPGGPSISNEAEKHLKELRIKNYKLRMFPRPLIHEENFDWSFSGLKTAVLREVKDKKLKAKERKKIAAEIQEAIVDSLVEKSISAVRLYKPKSFLLAGGVSANARLREKFVARIKSEKLQVLHVAAKSLCTDNAAFIATCAFYNYKPVDWKKITANPQLTIIEKYK